MTTETAALVQFTGYIQFGIMPHQHMLDDSQAQAGAAHLFVALDFGPVKSFGNPGNIGRRNTLALILNIQHYICQWIGANAL